MLVFPSPFSPYSSGVQSNDLPAPGMWLVPDEKSLSLTRTIVAAADPSGVVDIPGGRAVVDRLRGSLMCLLRWPYAICASAIFHFAWRAVRDYGRCHHGRA